MEQVPEKEEEFQVLLEKNPELLSIKDLESVIDYLNKQYRYGTEIVDDDTYDEYIDALREKKPKSRFLREIGAPVRDELEKVELPIWMGSMNKVKPNSKELTRWLSKYKGPYFCSAKLDGMSCLYGVGKLYTRGDGSVGQDISYLLPYLKLPDIAGTESEKGGDGVLVRGELIMKSKTFEKKYSDDFPKARSVVAGVINSKKPDPNILKHIDFVAFEVVETDIEDSLPASLQFEWLEHNDFEVPYNKSLDSGFDTDELTPLLQEMKRESPYEVDGVIIADDGQYSRNISDNPKYAVAYKVNAKGIKTMIEDVLWEPSMYGTLKPRIHFRTVIIDGDEVSYATAFNAKYVKDNHLRRGVEVKIVKSGDVIPYIIEVINPPAAEHVMTGRKADMPPQDGAAGVGEYEWNENEVELELVEPLKNSIVRRKRFVHFFKSLNIKYISDGVVKKFIEGGYETPNEIYEASVEDLMELDGIKEKSAQKFYDSIHNSLDNPIPIETVMKASLALGRGFGERKLYPLVSGINFVSGTKGKYKFRKPTLDEILEIEGFSYKSGREFRKNLVKFVKWMKDNTYIELEIPNQRDSENSDELPLDGKFILFTGVRNKELSKKLEKLGAKIEGSFTKKVNVLIVKDKNTTNSKTEKAVKQGIPVFGVDEAEKKLVV